MDINDDFKKFLDTPLGSAEGEPQSQLDEDVGDLDLNEMKIDSIEDDVASKSVTASKANDVDPEEDDVSNLDTEYEAEEEESPKVDSERDQLNKLLDAGMSVKEASEYLAKKNNPASDDVEDDVEEYDGNVESYLDEKYKDDINSCLDIEDDIKKIEAQLDELAENESLLTPEVRKLQRELNDLQRKFDRKELEISLNREKDKERILAEHDRKFEEAYAEECKYIESFYPDALKKGTPLDRAINKEIARLEKIGSPLLNDASTLSNIAFKQARLLGIAPLNGHAKSEEQKPAVSQKKAVEKQPLAPAGSKARGLTVHKGAPLEVSIADRMKKASNLSDLAEILNGDLYGSNKGSEFSMFNRGVR